MRETLGLATETGTMVLELRKRGVVWRGPEREAASPWQRCKDPAGDKNGLPTLISLSQTASWCSLPMASLSQELEGKGSPLAQP